MAYIFATRAFDMLGAAFDFGLAARMGEIDAVMDRSFTVRGTTYDDRVVVSPDAGGTHLVLASKGFSKGAYEGWVDGDIGGLFLSSGGQAKGVWAGIQGISVGVFEVDFAIDTFWRDDDLRLIERELWGADRFELSDEGDRALGYGGRDWMMGRDGADKLDGGAGGDRIEGARGADLLTGGSGGDVLLGGRGADWLLGGTGQDRLVGGSGKDWMRGGVDGVRDVFVFDSRSESPWDAQDTVVDFVSGVDRIDLRDIDARAGTSGDDAFWWSGQAAAKFSAWWVPGQEGWGTLRADVTGDARPDLVVQVTGTEATRLEALWGSDLLL